MKTFVEHVVTTHDIGPSKEGVSGELPCSKESCELYACAARLCVDLQAF